MVRQFRDSSTLLTGQTLSAWEHPESTRQRNTKPRISCPEAAGQRKSNTLEGGPSEMGRHRLAAVKAIEWSARKTVTIMTCRSRPRASNAYLGKTVPMQNAPGSRPIVRRRQAGGETVKRECASNGGECTLAQRAPQAS